MDWADVKGAINDYFKDLKEFIPMEIETNNNDVSEYHIKISGIILLNDLIAIVEGYKKK